MSKEQVRVKKGLYFGRKGTLKNAKTISEFSNKHGKVVFDRSNARYLVEENIRDYVAFDLQFGFHEYFNESDSEEEVEEAGEGIDEGDNLKDEKHGESELHFSGFCNWACLQPQASLKEVFGGADIVSYRATLRNIAKTAATHKRFDSRLPKERHRCETLEEFCRPASHENRSWARIAMRAGDVIMVGVDTVSPFIDDSEDEDCSDEEEENDVGGNNDGEIAETTEKKFDTNALLADIKQMRMDAFQQQWYSGYKFEQYMTSDMPQGESNTEKKLTFKLFETVMIADLEEEGFEPIRLCSFAEVDALRGDEPVELKSTFKEGWMSKLHTYLHCKFANKKTIVTGIRNEKYITTRVRTNLRLFSKGEPRIWRMTSNQLFLEESRADEKCYSFLYDVLAMTKHVLTRAKACRFVYLPKSGIIQFEPLTVAEAMKRGHGFSEETRFQLD